MYSAPSSVSLWDASSSLLLVASNGTIELAPLPGRSLLGQIMALSDEQQYVLWKTVFGNGEMGLDEMVRNNTRMLSTTVEEVRSINNSIRLELKTLNSTVEGMAKQQVERDTLAVGRKQAVDWLKWGLGIAATVVTLLAGAGAMQVSSTLSEVVNTLRQLPGLPE